MPEFLRPTSVTYGLCNAPPKLLNSSPNLTARGLGPTFLVSSLQGASRGCSVVDAPKVDGRKNGGGKRSWASYYANEAHARRLSGEYHAQALATENELGIKTDEDRERHLRRGIDQMRRAIEAKRNG